MFKDKRPYIYMALTGKYSKQNFVSVVIDNSGSCIIEQGCPEQSKHALSLSWHPSHSLWSNHDFLYAWYLKRRIIMHCGTLTHAKSVHLHILMRKLRPFQILVIKTPSDFGYNNLINLRLVQILFIKTPSDSGYKKMFKLRPYPILVIKTPSVSGKQNTFIFWL